MELRGRLAVVTGASSGIGAATARALAARGMRVVLLARDATTLEAVADRVRGTGGTAHVVPVDLADLDAARAAGQRCLDEVGTPDLVVNNAGAGRWVAVDATTPAEALAMTLVPYLGAFVLTATLAPGMVARGSGRIVNVTSPAAFTPFPGSAAYSVARGAMRHFTTALRSDLHGTGVSASLLVAGEVESAYWTHNPGSRDRLPRIARWYRVLQPEDVAEALVTMVQRDRRQAVVPPLLRATLVLHHLAPEAVQALVDRTGWRRPTAGG